MMQKKGGFPSMYQKVEYLEGNGQQYINTLCYERNIRIKCDIYTYTNVIAFGNYWPAPNIAIVSIVFHSSYSYYADVYKNINGAGRHKIDFDKNKISVDATSYNIKDIALADFTTGYPLTLFCCQHTTLYRGKVIFYGDIEIYENDELVRYFTPCYRKSDNKPGMYDTINNVFYTNQGTGEFIVGPDIN